MIIGSFFFLFCLAVVCNHLKHSTNVIHWCLHSVRSVPIIITCHTVHSTLLIIVHYHLITSSLYFLFIFCVSLLVYILCITVGILALNTHEHTFYYNNVKNYYPKHVKLQSCVLCGYTHKNVWVWDHNEITCFPRGQPLTQLSEKQENRRLGLVGERCEKRWRFTV